METSDDPFATTAVPADDPFAESGDDLEPKADAAEEVAAEPVPAEVPPAEAPAADPPIVDREGQPVAAQQPQPPEEAAQPPQEPATAPENAVAAPPAPETETEGDDGGQPPEEPPTSPPATEPPPADPPAESEAAKEMRLYKLLYQTGQSQWTEADLTNVADDLKQYVEKDGDELFLKARNNDHARRLSFTVLGRPENGVTVELVARTSWKPKRLAVAPPEPSRERLVIS